MTHPMDEAVKWVQASHCANQELRYKVMADCKISCNNGPLFMPWLVMDRGTMMKSHFNLPRYTLLYKTLM